MFNFFNTKRLALILSLLIIISFGGYVIYAWTGPTSAPPGSNAPQPLNIGTTDQDKAARISATEFYDADNSSFYINPSGNSSISGILTVGGDISDGAKTIYDSSSGRLDYSVLPYHKGDLTSDWSSNAVTSSYYDVSSLSAGNVVTGVNFGRGLVGTNAGQTCVTGTAGTGDIRSGKTADIDCDGVAESGSLLPPSGTAGVGDVRSGKTFYAGSWSAKTGTMLLYNGTNYGGFCIESFNDYVYENGCTGGMTGTTFCSQLGLTCLVGSRSSYPGHPCQHNYGWEYACSEICGRGGDTAQAWLCY